MSSPISTSTPMEKMGESEFTTDNLSASSSSVYNTNDSDIFFSSHYNDPAMQMVFLYFNAISRFLFGIFAFVSNAFLVHITIRYKNDLKSTSCYLLAVNALCDSIVAASTLLTILLTPMDLRLTVSLCLWLNALPEVAFNSTFVLVFLIALDRLFAVFFPIFYRKLSIGCYIICVSSIAVAIGMLIFSYGVIINMESPNEILFKCSIADFWLGDYGTLLQYSCLALTVPAILCYLLILLKLRCFNNSAKSIEINRGILRSLIVLVLVILIGWIFGMSLRWLIPLLIRKPVASGYILMSVSDLLLTIHGAASAFVLYFCSGDYRRIMRKEFGRLFRLNGTKMTTTTVQQLSANPQHSQTLFFQKTATNNSNNKLFVHSGSK